MQRTYDEGAFNLHNLPDHRARSAHEVFRAEDAVISAPGAPSYAVVAGAGDHRTARASGGADRALYDRLDRLESNQEGLTLRQAMMESLNDEDRGECPSHVSADFVLKHVHKPETFSGVSNGAGKSTMFREWLLQMENYLLAVSAPRVTCVQIAVSFLRGTAAAYWHARAVTLRRDGKNPGQWNVFCAAMLERYASRAPELAARAKLQELRQNSLTIHEYMTQFDDCYVHIPTYDEDDKVFRFLWGLRPEWQAKVAVNPSTAARWSSYLALTQFIVAHSAELMANMFTELGKHLGKRPRGDAGGGGHSRAPHPKRQKQGGGGGRKGKGPQYTKDGKRIIRLDDLDRDNPDANSVLLLRTARPNAPLVQRSARVVAYCMKNQLCGSCYGSEHVASKCTALPKPADALPAGCPRG